MGNTQQREEPRRSPFSIRINHQSKKSFLLLAITFSTFVLYAIHPATGQVFEPGKTYIDSTGYVEYIPGTLPVILSVPHGGYEEPTDIPDRNCPGCLYLRDSYTQELGRSMRKLFAGQVGEYPHLVVNLLHRKKFDANRNKREAADGNATVEKAWNAYHRFIDSAKAQVNSGYERGILIDLHGHAHDEQRLELGYLLRSEDLRKQDSTLNKPETIAKSSIQTLVKNNLPGSSHAQLLRGEQSLGTLLGNRGVRAVPSNREPFPETGQPYFSGGYNTRRHGSLEGGTIDAIQVECHQGVRFNRFNRERFAENLTNAINEFIDIHYDTAFLAYEEVTRIVQEKPADDLLVYPHPVTSDLNLKGVRPPLNLEFFTPNGVKTAHFVWRGEPLNVSFLDAGLYVLRVYSRTMEQRRIVVVF